VGTPPSIQRIDDKFREWKTKPFPAYRNADCSLIVIAAKRKSDSLNSLAVKCSHGLAASLRLRTSNGKGRFQHQIARIFRTVHVHPESLVATELKVLVGHSNAVCIPVKSRRQLLVPERMSRIGKPSEIDPNRTKNCFALS
jgi:hypothetical protein